MITPMKPKDDLKLFQKRNKDCLWSIKLDGVRVLHKITKCKKYGAEFYTHEWWSGNGKQLFNFKHLNIGMVEYVSKLDFTELILDGEMTAKNFSHVMTQLRRLKDIDPSIFEYHIFDIANRQDVPLRERLGTLATCKEQPGIWTVIHQYIPSEYAEEQAERIIEAGYEGIVLKSLDGLYEHKRSSEWCKVKARETLDCQVINAIEGQGKFKGSLGALVCKMPDSDKTFKVGTGFTDAERIELWDLKDHNDFPEIIEVSYMEITSHGVPRHPVFVRIREDK